MGYRLPAVQHSTLQKYLPGGPTSYRLVLLPLFSHPRTAFMEETRSTTSPTPLLPWVIEPSPEIWLCLDLSFAFQELPPRVHRPSYILRTTSCWYPCRQDSFRSVFWQLKPICLAFAISTICMNFLLNHVFKNFLVTFLGILLALSKYRKYAATGNC